MLITGHTGFKGSWLSLWLHSLGAEVFGYSREVPTSPSHFGAADVGDVVHTVYGDVADYARMEQTVRAANPEIVIHMAAQSLVRQSYRDPVETFRTNVLGTAHLLEAVRQAGDPVAVLVVTSDKCYENSPPYVARSEGDAIGGSDPYSSSKACSELVARAFRAPGLAGMSAPPVVTARAGNVIGGGDWASERIVPDIVRAAESGGVLEVRSPKAIRPWQHVVDCLAGYLTLIERLAVDPELPSAWNFGPDSQQERSVAWMVEAMTGVLGREVEVHAGESDGLREADHLMIDSRQARDVLGWEPVWGIEESVRLTADWYRQVWNGEDARAVTLSQLDLHGKSI